MEGAKGPSQAWTLPEQVGEKVAAQGDGAVASTGRARIGPAETYLLQAPAEAVPRLSQGGLGMQQGRQGELGSRGRTVLANEQVIDGALALGALVEKREMLANGIGTESSPRTCCDFR